MIFFQNRIDDAVEHAKEGIESEMCFTFKRENPDDKFSKIVEVTFELNESWRDAEIRYLFKIVPKQQM